MSNLLKEAIADAKAVKAMAIENAKVALEETFKREVTGMFEKKIAEELQAESMDELDSSKIGSGTAAPAKQSVTHNAGLETGATLDEEEGSEEITNEDLEEILRGLEEEMAQNPAVPSPAPVDPMAQQAPVVPPAVPAVPAVPVDPMAQQAPVASVPPVPPIDAAAQPAAAPQPPVAEAEEELEEINLEELLSQLEEEEVVAEELISEKEEGEEEEEDDEENAKKEAVEETVDEVAGLRQELQEHVKVIEYLREQINEINLLNAKLLYTNKLFKQYSLNNSQKLNIVEKFDLATSIREVKYAYTILAESLSSGASTVKKTNTVAKNITEGLASKAVASTKPSKDVIVENTNEMASRFQRLAGIKK